MLKNIFITILLICSVLVVWGQKSVKVKVSGNIITTDGVPAEFINIQLKNTFYGGTSDGKGYFEFMAPAGQYTMIVQSIAAHRREFPVTIEEGKENHFADIEIRENVNQLEQVVVTGQFSPQSMRNSLYKVRTVNSEQIRQKAPTSVQSLLNTEIGIRLSNDMALGETDFELMGMSGNNVKILLDGIPLIDRGETKQSLSQLDVNSIERVEIVEGPMSVVYGTDALAGVINIITKKGDGYSEENTWRVGARVQEESMGKEYDFFKDKGLHNESIDLGFNHKSGLFVNGGYTRNNHGGWQGDLTGREKRWHPKDQALMNGMFGFQNRNMNVWYRLDFLDEKIFGPNNGSELQPEKVSDKDFLTKRYTHQLQSDWKLDNRLDVHAALSYQDYKRRTRTTESDLSTGEKWLSSAEASQDITQYKAWIARATVAWNIAPEFSVQPGVEYQWTQGEGGRIDGTPKVSDLAFFLSAEYKPWEWLSLRPGVRTFIVADYDAPIAIPSVLTKFKLTKHMDLRLSYAYGFRSPTLQELYFSFHNDNHDIDGNPDLKAEYSHNITGSVAYRVLHSEKIHLTTTLSGFYNDFRDKISLAQNVDIPNYNTYYNIDRYKTVGGSLENSLSWGGLRANLNVSLIGRYNRYATGNKSMPRFRYSPEVSTSISYHIEKTGTDISLFYKYTGERKEYYYHEYTTADNKKESEIYLRGMKSYHTGDLTVTQKLTSFLHLNAGVKNLFNLTSLETIAESPNDTPSVSYLGCGRSWSVGLSFLLNGKFN